MAWVELYPGREWTLDKNNVSKDFSFVIHADNPGEFVDEAETVEFNGITMLMDDTVVQRKIFEVFSPYAPTLFLFQVNDEITIPLALTSMSVKMINFDTWRVDVTFEVPSDGDNAGYGGSYGASDGEENSEQFTQVSFNAVTTPITIQRAKLIEKQLSTHSAFADDEIPTEWEVGKIGYIGESDEGIEGAEVLSRSFTFSIIQYMAPTKLTYAYVRRLSRLVTCVNQSTFFGFPKGTVMLTGASGQGDLYQNVPVTLEFEVRNNFKFDGSHGDFLPAPAFEQRTGSPPVVNNNNMYDTIGDWPMPSTEADLSLPGGAGVHSGWSIVDYRRKNIPTEDNERNLSLPWARLIWFYYGFAEFAEFQL